MSSAVSRRNVVKGAAWAVPSISLAAAAPAMAGSPIPVLVANNTVLNGTLPSGGQSGDQEFRVYTSPNNRNDPPNSVSSCGPEITGSTASTTVTSVSQIYWLPQNNLTFVNSSSGAATSGWSVLTRSAALDGSHTDTSGRKLYAYVTNYSGTGTYNAGTGTTCLGIQNFVSTNSTTTTRASYDSTLSATINGKVQNVVGVKVPMP